MALHKIKASQNKVFFLENPDKTCYHDLYKDNKNYEQLVFFDYEKVETPEKPKLTLLITA